MKALLASLVIAVPVVIAAEPPAAEEWIVSEVTFHGQYQEGDLKNQRFFEYLFIDSRYTAGDFDPDPSAGRYAPRADVADPHRLVDQRQGGRGGDEWDSLDLVLIADRPEVRFEAYGVQDWDIRRRDGLSDRLDFHYQTPQNIVSGDGLEQNFSTIARGSGGGGGGFYERIVDGVRAKIAFFMIDLTVKSQVCRR